MDHRIVFALVVSCFAVATVDSIACFVCNSHNDSSCGGEIESIMPRVDCSMLDDGANYTVCRKIVQLLEFEVDGAQPDSRVIRECGQGDKIRCYHRSGFGAKQEVCSCDHDMCNSSMKISKFSTAITVLLASITFFLLN